jgi:hypothetical protein
VRLRDQDSGTRFGDVGLVEDIAEFDLLTISGRKEVGQTEDLSLEIFLILHTLEVSALDRSVVADVCLLLLVDLTCVHDLFDGTR